MTFQPSKGGGASLRPLFPPTHQLSVVLRNRLREETALVRSQARIVWAVVDWTRSDLSICVIFFQSRRPGKVHQLDLFLDPFTIFLFHVMLRMSSYVDDAWCCSLLVYYNSTSPREMS